MENLIEQLEYNNDALKSLDTRYENTLTSVYYNHFKTETERIEELGWILKIRKRVLRLRYRILENIQSETTKMMQETSTLQRNVTLKDVA